MKKKILLLIALFAFVNIFAQDCNLNETAKRHVGRAQGFKAMAEKDEDYQNVLNEYQSAFQYAPNCPDICYNVAYSAEMLGKTDPNYCDVAIEYYRKYLQINPKAADRNEIETKIYEVEAKKEIYEYDKFLKFCGVWKHTDKSYNLSDKTYEIKHITGNKFQLINPSYLNNNYTEYYGESYHLRVTDINFHVHDGYLKNDILYFESKRQSITENSLATPPRDKEIVSNTLYIEVSWEDNNHIHIRTRISDLRRCFSNGKCEYDTGFDYNNTYERVY